jgi:hypothetical protein
MCERAIRSATLGSDSAMSQRGPTETGTTGLIVMPLT